MWDWIATLVFILVVARVGRFLASEVTFEEGESHWRCQNVGWNFQYHHGVHCQRLRGHWGKHRTEPQGELGWYEEWPTGKPPKVVGFDF